MESRTNPDDAETPAADPTRLTRRSALRGAAGFAAAASVAPLATACSSDEGADAETASAATSTEPAAATASTSSPDPVDRVRRSVAALDAGARSDFVAAVHELKRTQSPIDPSLSYYDQFVHFHQQAVIQSRFIGHGVAHNSPSFLPWHRKLCLLFEDALMSVSGGTVTLPYWDWTDDAALDVVFADDLMGPRTGDPDDNYAVTSGPFARGEWNLNLIAVPLGNGDTLEMCPFGFLTRANTWVDLADELEAAGLTELPLPTVEEVDDLMAIPTYDSPPYDFTADPATSFRCVLEGNKPGTLPFLHNGIHSWVGGSWSSVYYDGTYQEQDIVFVGTLTALDTSPNDPTFFLHHCNVDRLWAVWEDIHGSSYEPIDGSNPGWNLDDEMYPYSLHAGSDLVMRQGITNASMLEYRKLGYSYE